MDMQDQNPQPEAPLTPAEPEHGSRRTIAWISMGAVAAALALYTLIPQTEVDLNAPPPAANATDPATGLATSPDAAPEDAAFLGKPAPLDFTLKEMNGADVKLSSFKGKVIFLNFWATWCGPCKQEIPWIVELQDKYRDDLVVLGFSVDDTVEKMKPYADEYKVNYPMLVGLGREDVQDAYGPLWAIPVSVIIDRDGKIAYRHSGIATQEEFEQAIKAAL